MLSRDVIQFVPLGGGQEIGANCYLLDFDGKKIVLDCGTNPQKTGYDALPSFEDIEDEISAIVITHSHTDHIGSLPVLCKKYPRAKIFLSSTTLKIAQIMFADTYKVLTRFGASAGLPQYFFYSFYEKENISKLIDRVVKIENYNEWFPIVDNLSCLFFDSGHILGSCGVVISNGKNKVVYTGDICIQPQETINGFDYSCLKYIKNPDLLIIESTYGADGKIENTSRKEEKNNFFEEMHKILLKGGSILLPAFALGKTQELLFLCYEFLNKYNLYRKFKVHIAGLGSAVNKIYKKLLSREKKYILEEKFYDEINVSEILCDYRKGLKLNKNFIIEESLLNKIIEDEITSILKEPSIIIATSGMLEPNSFSWRFAKQMLSKEHNAIFFTGYVDANSFGNRILNLGKDDLIKFSESEDVITNRCGNIKKFNFTSHINRKEILEFVREVNPKSLILVHGDKDATYWLENNLKNYYPTVAPKNLETIYFNLSNNEIRRTQGMRAIIITVGTSLIQNYNNYLKEKNLPTKEFSQITKEEIFQFLEKTPPQKTSAETNTLSKIGLKDGDYMYFICTETPDCIFCGKILSELYANYQNKNILTESITIKNLTKEVEVFRNYGLINFINVIVDIADKFFGNIVICATGGFKVEIAYATLIGILLRQDIFYIHDDFKSVMCLPHIPISFNFEYFDIYNNQINDILNAPTKEEARKIINSLPKELRIIFDKDDVLNCYKLSPIGVAFHRAYIYHSRQKQKDVPIRIYKSHSTIFGDKIEKISDIRNDDIRKILERISKHHNLVTGFYFDEMKQGKSPENYLEFKNKQLGALRYLIHTTSGSQYIKIQTYKGMEDYLLDLLGRKIYP